MNTGSLQFVDSTDWIVRVVSEKPTLFVSSGQQMLPESADLPFDIFPRSGLETLEFYRIVEFRNLAELVQNL